MTTSVKQLLEAANAVVPKITPGEAQAMIANFTALAMEPQGHLAGTASSLYGSITTLLGIGIGTTIGQAYDGTLLPFATGFFLATLASLAVVIWVEKGRLFRPHRPDATPPR